ncbi:MAG: dTMP kinase [Acidimicrobiia bacterium]
MTPGRYIVLEGSEGCGKSTHAARLGAELGAVVTRETGGTGIGKLIRNVLHDPSHTHLEAKAEALLIAADRAQHMAEVVGPALAAGRHVVSDRSVYSSLAYQSYGRGLPYDVVSSVNDWALDGHWPELVLLLDVPNEQLATRMQRRELDRFERESAEFHDRVRAGFLEMAAKDPERWVLVDANRSHSDVAAAIRTAVRERLGL